MCIKTCFRWRKKIDQMNVMLLSNYGQAAVDVRNAVFDRWNGRIHWRLSDCQAVASDADFIKCSDDCLIVRYLAVADGLLNNEMTQTWRGVKMMLVFKLQLRVGAVIRGPLLIIWNDFFHATRWIEFLLSLFLIFFSSIRHVVWENHEVFVFDDCWQI